MDQNNIEIIRWPEDETPDEKTIRTLLSQEGLNPYRWSNSPGDVYGAHAHSYDKVIYVVKGSITFGLPDTGGHAALCVGDRLNLPAGVTHNAVVGDKGVVCLEAHR